MAPSTPDGTSTATTGPARRGQRLDHGQRHAVKRPGQPGAEQRVDDELGAVQARDRERLDRARPSRRGPGRVALERLLGRTRLATRTGQPARCSSRATTQPSPPLLPGPHRTSVGRGAKRAVIARVTARPAFSISQGPGRPPAIAARSTAAMAAGGRSDAVGAHAPRLGAQTVRWRACARALDRGGRQPVDVEPVADQLEHLQLGLGRPAVGRGHVAGERVGGLAQGRRQGARRSGPAPRPARPPGSAARRRHCRPR